MKAPLPPNEQERLQALHGSGILNSVPERSYDQLTELAATICGTPIAILSFIDSDRQWFKSKLGIPFQETSREVSFCAHTILQRDLLVVPDTVSDERFGDNPLVTSEPHIRFYAGAPLITPEGHAREVSGISRAGMAQATHSHGSLIVCSATLVLAGGERKVTAA